MFNPAGIRDGGQATDGCERILGILPTKLHQRVSVALRSKEEVERVTANHREAS